MILQYQNYNPVIGKNSWVAETATVIGDVEIGEDSAIWFGSVIRGDVHKIIIGNRTNIQDISMVHVTHHKTVERDMNNGNPTIIGNDVTIGHRVMLHGCKIGNAVLIGMSATILDGAEIGDESIVGAGTLVTKNKKFPPRSLILGSPAKVVRELSEKEIIELYASAKRYVDFKNNYQL
jgi:carbonic anhydrase/acetyltransferase-like protein (isoleucine patch superfamily)